jgi:hypothetical protein
VSLRVKGEIQTHGTECGKPNRLRGSVGKRCWGHSGDWRRKGQKAQRVNQGDPTRKESAFIEAKTLTKN